MKEIENEHYLRHVTDLGEKHTIIANEDIHTNKGIKLVSAGTRVNSSFYKEILKHKLLNPIDQSLSIEDRLTPAILEKKAQQAIKQNTLLENMQKNSANGELLSSLFNSLEIHEILLFKLTVAEKQLPQLFNHCLNVAIASIYISIELKQNEESLKVVAIAGLFHDIGLLHLDINLLNNNKQLSENNRKQIYSHPIVASLILKTFPDYKLISRAILEHHERMDGSGYPQGLVGEQIDLAGQILIAAELAVSLTEQKTNCGYKNRLLAILKFNNNQYPHKTVDILLKSLSTLKENSNNHSCILSKEDFLNKLSSVWLVINAWNYRNDKGLKVPHDISNYISQHLAELTHALNMSGLALNDISLPDDDLNEILKEPKEMLALLNEAEYQIKNIINEINRRWPERTVDEDMDTYITKWLASVEELLPEPNVKETL